MTTTSSLHARLEMKTSSTQDLALEDLKEALRTDDWMQTTQALDRISQVLSILSENHQFPEVFRVSHHLALCCRDYLTSPTCTVEIARTLAPRSRLSPQDILGASQPGILKILTSELAKYGSLSEKDQLYATLIHKKDFGLCNLIYAAQDIQDISGYPILGALGSPDLVQRDSIDCHQLLRRCFETLIITVREGAEPASYWVSLAIEAEEAIKNNLVLWGYGADAPLAFHHLGLNGLRDHYAHLAAAVVPRKGDAGHFDKLRTCGYVLSRDEKRELSKMAVEHLADQKHEDKHEAMLDMVSAIMVLDFDLHDDLAHSSKLTDLSNRHYLPALCKAANYLWAHRADDRKQHLVLLLDGLLKTEAAVKKYAELITDELLKNLKHGREHAFSRDLGL